jgi:hypothetical protein
MRQSGGLNTACFENELFCDTGGAACPGNIMKASVMTTGVALLTASYPAIKAVVINPVKVLNSK